MSRFSHQSYRDRNTYMLRCYTTRLLNLGYIVDENTLKVFRPGFAFPFLDPMIDPKEECIVLDGIFSRARLQCILNFQKYAREELKYRGKIPRKARLKIK